MADQKSIGGLDANLMQPIIGGVVADKYRQGIFLGDPDVLAARVNLALVNGVYRVPVSLPLAQHTNDFWVEVARGNVPGFTSVQVVGNNPNVGTSFEDIWDAGNKLVYPTTGEQWEVVSNSADDTSAGTGAQEVTVQYLDDNGVEQVEVKAMNGVTPVVFTATDAFRFIRCLVSAWGTTLENQGDIDVRVISAGATRGKIVRDITVPADPMGLNISLDAHYTVPAGKTAFVIAITTSLGKGQDANIKALIRRDNTGGFTASGEVPQYQSSFTSEFNRALSGLPAGTDIKIIARSSNVAAPVSVFLSILEVDD